MEPISTGRAASRNGVGENARPTTSRKHRIDYGRLSDAGKVINQHMFADGKHPELLDQLNDESERHNYFFEPYHSLWSPPVELTSTKQVPQALLDQYSELEVLSLMDLLPEINRAWLSIDNKLFIWNYANGEDFTMYDGLDQVIVSVGLVRPRSAVFKDFVKFLLVIATPVEVVLLAVSFENDDVLLGNLILRPTQFSVPSDNVNMLKIVGTKVGRIFMAGKDGGLYELVYDGDEGLNSYMGWSKKCRKLNHSSSPLTGFLPSFIRNLGSGSSDPLVDIALDNERNILYTISATGSLDVYDLGDSGEALQRVTNRNVFREAATFCARNHRRSANCPDSQLFEGRNVQQIVGLSVIPTAESRAVHLIAVSSLGIRFYFTTFPSSALVPGPEPQSSLVPLNAGATGSQNTLMGAGIDRKGLDPRSIGTAGLPPMDVQRSGRERSPTTLEVVHIRLPPPTVDPPASHEQREPFEGLPPAIVPGKSPANVYTSFYRHGILLLADSVPERTDNMVAVSRDLITNRSVGVPYQTHKKIGFREAMTRVSIPGKVWAIAEAPAYAQPDAYQESDLKGQGSITGSKRVLSTTSTGQGNQLPDLHDLASQHLGSRATFLCLTTRSLHVLTKVRPLDYLFQILASRQHDSYQLETFFRYFGVDQTCAMLFSLACGVPRDIFTSIVSAKGTGSGRSDTMMSPGGIDSQTQALIKGRAIRAIFDFGGHPGVMDYRPMSSGSAVVMHDDIYMSGHHNGLCLFLCRLLRPLWNCSLAREIPSKSEGTSSVSSKLLLGAPTKPKENVQVSRFTRSLLEEMKEPLWQLQRFMETATPYALAINRDDNPALDDFSKPSRGNLLTRVLALHSQQEQLERVKKENALRTEQRSLASLYRLVVRCVEGLSLLIVACNYVERTTPRVEEKAHKIFGSKLLARVTFADFVTTPEGDDAARSIVERLMAAVADDGGEASSLSELLRVQSSSFFSLGDLLQYRGQELLQQAKKTQNEYERDTLLEESLKEFMTAAEYWTSASYVNALRDICMEYRALNYFKGVVDLSLRLAFTYARGDVSRRPEAAVSDTSSLPLVPHGSTEEERSITCRRECYNCVLDLLQELLEGGSKGGGVGSSASLAVTSGTLALSLSPEEKEMEALKSLNRSLASDDTLFQEELCSWLIQRGHEELLVKARSGFIENFLRSRNPGLLCQHYVLNQRFAEAARVEEYLAHREEPNPEANPVLMERIQHLTRAIQYAQSGTSTAPGSFDAEGMSNGDRLFALQEKLDVAKLQLEVLDELKRQTEARKDARDFEGGQGMRELEERESDIRHLTYQLLSVSKLYNQFAARYKMWESCLSLMFECRHDDPALIQRHWKRIILRFVPRTSGDRETAAWLAQCHMEGDELSYTQSSFEDATWIAALRGKLVALGRKLYNPGSDFCFPVRFLCEELETFALRFREMSRPQSTSLPAEFWVAGAMVDVGVPFLVLQETYKALYQKHSNSVWVVHLLESWHFVMVTWLKYAASPRAPQLERVSFSDVCPLLMKDLDAYVTDLQAMSSVTIGASREAQLVCLGSLRRLKSEMYRFREDYF